MGLREICKDCKTEIDTAMYEVKTEKPSEIPIFIHLKYCPGCNEYKGNNGNFPVGNEMEAILDEFELMFYSHQDLGKVVGYELKIPLNKDRKS